MTVLTPRFTQAIEYARIAHAGRFRRGTRIPYLYHLLGVASLVLEYGGSEDQAIAALLHDVLEDCGDGHEAGIRAQFGDAVANIVKDCTDGRDEASDGPQSDAEKFAAWVERVSATHGYTATISGVGDEDPELGSPTQLAVLTRGETDDRTEGTGA